MKFLFLIFVALIAFQTCPEDGWRGIVPLKSTRADVERLLGTPKSHEPKEVPEYFLKDENVVFFYSQERCANGWNVPPDTVIGIRAIPKPTVEVKDLNLDLTKFKKSPGDFDVPDHFYYEDEDRGFSISVRNGIAQEYIYGPKNANKLLRCPDYWKDAEKKKDCLPVGLKIECSSELIRLGSPVVCKVKLGPMLPEIIPTLEWNVSNGASVHPENSTTVRVNLVDPAVENVSLSVRVTAPNLCFDKASTKFQVVKSSH